MGFEQLGKPEYSFEDGTAIGLGKWDKTHWKFENAKTKQSMELSLHLRDGGAEREFQVGTDLKPENRIALFEIAGKINPDLRKALEKRFDENTQSTTKSSKFSPVHNRAWISVWDNAYSKKLLFRVQSQDKPFFNYNIINYNR